MTWRVSALVYFGTNDDNSILVDLATGLSTEPTDAQVVNYGNSFRSSLVGNVLGGGAFVQKDGSQFQSFPVSPAHIWLNRDLITHFYVYKQSE